MSRWTFRMSFCSSNAGMEMSASLINAIDNKLRFTPTHTSIRCHLKSFTSCAFFLVDSLPQILQWHVLRSGLFDGKKSESSYGFLTLFLQTYILLILPPTSPSMTRCKRLLFTSQFFHILARYFHETRGSLNFLTVHSCSQNLPLISLYY